MKIVLLWRKKPMIDDQLLNEIKDKILEIENNAIINPKKISDKDLVKMIIKTIDSVGDKINDN